MAVIEADRYAGYFAAGVERSIADVLLRTRRYGEHLLSLADETLALHVLSFALPLEGAWETTRDVLLALAPKMDQAGHWETWRPFLEQGIERNRAHGDGAAQVELLFHLGLLHQRRGRVDEALAAYEKSAALCAAIGDAQGEGQALNRQAFICVYLQHNVSQARALVDRALALPASPGERAYTLFVQGEIANAQRNWTEAISHFEVALDMRRSDGEQRMVARTLLSMGRPLTMLQRHEEAIACYREALQLFSAVEDTAAEAITQMNWGNTLLMLERYDEALIQYAAAEPLFRRLHDEVHLAKVAINQGMALRRSGCVAQAEAAIQLAIQRWQQMGNARELINALDELGLVYLDQEKREQARAVFAQALERLDALRDEPATYGFFQEMLGEHLRQAEQAEVDPH